MIKKHDFHLETKTTSGNTALLIAAGIHHASVVDWLLKRGADKTAVANEGYNALHHACGSRGGDSVECLATIRVLIENYHFSVDAQIREDKSQTPLMLAAYNDRLFLVQYLILNAGASLQPYIDTVTGFRRMFGSKLDISSSITLFFEACRTDLFNTTRKFLTSSAYVEQMRKSTQLIYSFDVAKKPVNLMIPAPTLVHTDTNNAIICPLCQKRQVRCNSLRSFKDHVMSKHREQRAQLLAKAEMGLFHERVTTTTSDADPLSDRASRFSPILHDIHDSSSTQTAMDDVQISDAFHGVMSKISPKAGITLDPPSMAVSSAPRKRFKTATETIEDSLCVSLPTGAESLRLKSRIESDSSTLVGEDASFGRIELGALQLNMAKQVKQLQADKLALEDAVQKLRIETQQLRADLLVQQASSGNKLNTQSSGSLTNPSQSLSTSSQEETAQLRLALMSMRSVSQLSESEDEDGLFSSSSSDDENDSTKTRKQFSLVDHAQQLCVQYVAQKSIEELADEKWIALHASEEAIRQRLIRVAGSWKAVLQLAPTPCFCAQVRDIRHPPVIKVDHVPVYLQHNEWRLSAQFSRPVAAGARRQRRVISVKFDPGAMVTLIQDRRLTRRLRAHHMGQTAAGVQMADGSINPNFPVPRRYRAHVRVEERYYDLILHMWPKQAIHAHNLLGTDVLRQLNWSYSGNGWLILADA